MSSSWLIPTGFTILPHIGSVFNAVFIKDDNSKWYNSLKMPAWKNPKSITGLVWSALYTGVGYGSYLVYRDSTGPTRKLALSAYALHIAINWTWPTTFFKTRRLGLATIHLELLWATIIPCFWTFYKINKTAGYLWIPYFLWASHKLLLMIYIWRNNKKNSIN